MTSITDKTISKLFGLAAGRCSMCKIEVVQQDVKIGEMAHIIAKNKGGARGNIPIEGDINGYDNLILLCPNHHTEVDNNEDAFPPERLHRYKQEHEAYVLQVFAHQSQGRVMDVAGLKALMLYLPFSQMIILTDGLPERFDHKLFYVADTLGNFANDNPQCRPFSDANLESYYRSFSESLDKLIDYEQEAVIGDKNVYMPGHLVNADSNRSYLNRELDFDERRQAIADVKPLLENLVASYHQILAYLKSTYPEVHLASFVGW
ncbi:HNH endonuclease signature motif containing protein [Paraburkholderia tropica]|uniref:HNH endonuclease n=1 Tax=Paraburkholderia tropica TaxID=92647 RepID=A0AAQ1GME4_9BURK|nr:HNH endonuclease signature motif containing protein [Paraburkholderia tropica]RQN37314.1 HNH endonuclease [Paraburkholderia tropica]SEK12886.1 HNH endonuclease [Paraburkholderia tropica]